MAELLRGAYQRIILTRPAVEAGEKLGFLPGDLAEKVNPYLRPLYDALYDMVGMEKGGQMMERQLVEVAPLAFMRGRTQPLSSGVLTPDGFRPIGSLRVGDLVTGTDGRPTPVLGVYGILPAGPLDLSMPVPNDPALMDVLVGLQGVALVFAPPEMVELSNALAVQLGH